MPRSPRMKLLARSRSLPSLEVLEDRRLLSASPLSQAIHPAGLSVVPAGSVVGESLTPAQVRMAYGLTSVANEGQGTTIAIVDAFNDPDIASDANEFSQLFGLPQLDGIGGDPTLRILTPPGQATPPTSPGGFSWAFEESIDVEWTHTMAPMANIDLVETQSDSFNALFAAEVNGAPFESGVGYAKSLPGVVVVSNSYGSNEFNGENSFDSEFTTPGNNVAFTFATGDGGAPGGYPADAPDVVAVGGTILNTISARGVYGAEAGWRGSGGGVSQFEPTPAFQSSNGVNFGARSIPDISIEGATTGGVFIVDSFDAPADPTIEAGGTSVGTPMWAGIIALADQSRIAADEPALDSVAVDSALYGAYNSPAYKTDFHDITVGNNGFAAGPGYDLVTGIGTPKAQFIVPLLANAAGDSGPAPAALAAPAAVTHPAAAPSMALHAAAGLAGTPVEHFNTRFDAIPANVSATTPAPQAVANTVTVALPGGQSQVAQAMLTSSGGESSATAAAADAATVTEPAPTETGIFTASAATEGISLPAAPAVTPATWSGIPGTGDVGASDALFADYRPVEPDGVATAPLLPSVVSREEFTANLAGCAGTALALGGVWTYLTPKQGETLEVVVGQSRRRNAK